MGEFTVTSSQVREKAQYLRNLNSQLKAKIELLETTEASLNGMWEGDAHDTFDSKFKANKAKMISFYNGIDKYAAALDNIASKYEAAEAKNVATASSN